MITVTEKNGGESKFPREAGLAGAAWAHLSSGADTVPAASLRHSALCGLRTY